MQMSFLGVEKHTGRARNGAWYENNTTILGPNNPRKDKIPSVGEMRQKQSENLITQTATAVFLQLKNDLQSWISKKDIQDWNAAAYERMDIFPPWAVI